MFGSNSSTQSDTAGAITGQVGTRGWIRWWMARPGWSLLVIGLFTLVLNAGLTWRFGLPIPVIHDEFSYLLAADTFAHGRLTNPTHPLWEHFETWHVLQQPTYQSKFPPGSAAVMALGTVLGGNPIVGVWLSFAAACMALTWMLRAWLPVRFAILGGLLPALNPSLVNWWGQSYWGGSLAMLGGALVFGALRRLVRTPHTGHSLVLGAGLALLAVTRPYEGFVASLPVAVVLGVSMFRTTHATTAEARLFRKSRASDLRDALCKIVVPVAAILLPAAAALAWYNTAVTGDPLRLPYQVYEETYTRRATLAATLFSWTDLSTRPRDISPLPSQTGVEAAPRSDLDPLTAAVVKAYRNGQFYIDIPLAAPLALFPWILLRRWMRFAFVTVAAVGAAILAQRTAGHPHYAAPVACLVFVLALQGLRYLRVWRRGRLLSGRFWTRAVVAGIAVVFLWRLPHRQPIAESRPWSVERARLLAELEADDQQHLVIVRYGPQHSIHDEWVYNRADIDGAKVVWARDHFDGNRRLLDYFSDRCVWLLEPDEHPVRLERVANGASRENASGGGSRTAIEGQSLSPTNDPEPLTTDHRPPT